MAKKRKAEFNSAVTRFYDNKSHGKYLQSKALARIVYARYHLFAQLDIHTLEMVLQRPDKLFARNIGI